MNSYFSNAFLVHQNLGWQYILNFPKRKRKSLFSDTLFKAPQPAHASPKPCTRDKHPTHESDRKRSSVCLIWSESCPSQHVVIRLFSSVCRADARRTIRKFNCVDDHHHENDEPLFSIVSKKMSLRVSRRRRRRRHRDQTTRIFFADEENDDRCRREVICGRLRHAEQVALLRSLHGTSTVVTNWFQLSMVFFWIRR